MNDSAFHPPLHDPVTRPINHLEQQAANIAPEGLHPQLRFVNRRFEITIPKEHAWQGVEDTFVGMPGESVLELVARIHEVFLARGIGAKSKEAA